MCMEVGHSSGDIHLIFHDLSQEPESCLLGYTDWLSDLKDPPVPVPQVLELKECIATFNACFEGGTQVILLLKHILYQLNHLSNSRISLDFNLLQKVGRDSIGI